MIGVLVSGEGTNLQALVDAGLPIAAVASNRSDARALTRASVPSAAFELADYADRHGRDSSSVQELRFTALSLRFAALRALANRISLR